MNLDAALADTGRAVMTAAALDAWREVIVTRLPGGKLAVQQRAFHTDSHVCQDADHLRSYLRWCKPAQFRDGWSPLPVDDGALWNVVVLDAEDEEVRQVAGPLGRQDADRVRLRRQWVADANRRNEQYALRRAQ
jgi:hypothetical protein